MNLQEMIFAINGDKNAVPVTPDGSSMSYQEGYNPLTDSAIDSGGIPISRGQSNTLFYNITKALAEIQKYGAMLWDATVEYPQGSLVTDVISGVAYQYRARDSSNLGIRPSSNALKWLNVTYFAPLPTAPSDLQVGAIIATQAPVDYAVTQYPTFLPCNGSVVSRLGDFSDLFLFAQSAGLIVPEATKTVANYGDGDGVSTFSLPNYQGLFFRNADDGTLAPFGTYQDDTMQQHAHSTNAYSASVSAGSAKLLTEGFGVDAGVTLSYTEAGAGPVRVGQETRPKSVVVNYLVKFK